MNRYIKTLALVFSFSSILNANMFFQNQNIEDDFINMQRLMNNMMKQNFFHDGFGKFENINYPICTGGKRDGPIEDCGGIWEYNDIVYAIENKQYDKFEHLLDEDGEFYYKGLNPTYFDKNQINKKLR
jgi:hypothetical protein